MNWDCGKYHFFAKVLILMLIGSLAFQCDDPIAPNKIDDDVEFDLTADKGEIIRIIDQAAIHLEWSEIVIHNFKEIQILRYNHERDPDSYPVDQAQDGWVLVGSTENEFTQSWIDTVDDDAKFTYSIRYVDQDNNYREAIEEVELPHTTSLRFPEEVDSLHKAIESWVIDEGDTIHIGYGIFNLHAFSFQDKAIHLIGRFNPAVTKLIWQTRYNEGGNVINDESFIAFDGGSLQNVTVESAVGEIGGGVKMTGNAVLKHCIIKECTATANPALTKGLGGAVFMSDNASMTNCIVQNDSTFLTHAGIYIDEFGIGTKITNCVIYNNHLVSRTTDAMVQNCIFYGAEDYPYPFYPNFYKGTNATVRYSSAGPAWHGVDTTNVLGDPKFFNSPRNFYLNMDSPCINAGNPKFSFNDIDGTRNDIGAFGGPEGDWYKVRLYEQ